MSGILVTPPIVGSLGASGPGAGGPSASGLGTETRDWFALLKPRVMTLVVFTGAIGLFIAPTFTFIRWSRSSPSCASPSPPAGQGRSTCGTTATSTP